MTSQVPAVAGGLTHVTVWPPFGAKTVALGGKTVALRPKVSPWPAKTVTLAFPKCRLGLQEPSPCRSQSVALPRRSVALRRGKVTLRRLAPAPRAPDRLRPRPALGHHRNALAQAIGGLPRHSHGPRRRGDLSVPRERIEKGVGLAVGPAVFGVRARWARLMCVCHPAG